MKYSLFLAGVLAAFQENEADAEKPPKPKPQTFLPIETAGADFAPHGE
jgi:hypothetical protein